MNNQLPSPPPNSSLASRPDLSKAPLLPIENEELIAELLAHENLQDRRIQLIQALRFEESLIELLIKNQKGLVATMEQAIDKEPDERKQLQMNNALMLEQDALDNLEGAAEMYCDAADSILELASNDA